MDFLTLGGPAHYFLRKGLLALFEESLEEIVGKDFFHFSTKKERKCLYKSKSLARDLPIFRKKIVASFLEKNSQPPVVFYESYEKRMRFFNA